MVCAINDHYPPPIHLQMNQFGQKNDSRFEEVETKLTALKESLTRNEEDDHESVVARLDETKQEIKKTRGKHHEFTARVYNLGTCVCCGAAYVGEVAKLSELMSTMSSTLAAMHLSVVQLRSTQQSLPRDPVRFSPHQHTQASTPDSAHGQHQQYSAPFPTTPASSFYAAPSSSGGVTGATATATASLTFTSPPAMEPTVVQSEAKVEVSQPPSLVPPPSLRGFMRQDPPTQPEKTNRGGKKRACARKNYN